jgi:chromosome segregation ATPase
LILKDFVILQIEPKDDEISQQSKQLKSLKDQIEESDNKLLNLKSEMQTQNTTLQFSRRDRDKIALQLNKRNTFVQRFQGEPNIVSFKQLITSVA